MHQRAISPSPTNAVPPVCVIAAAAPNDGVNRSADSTWFAAAGLLSRLAPIVLGSIAIERIGGITTLDPHRVAINPSIHRADRPRQQISADEQQQRRRRAVPQ